MMEGLAFQADKALLDTVFDGVVVIDLKTLRISLANKAATAILDFDDPDELLGVDPLKLVLPEDRQRVAGILAGPVSGNCLQAGTEMRVLDKKGRELWITARAAKLGSNGTSALVASFKDITTQKMLDIALREAEERQIHLLNTSNELILICQDWKIVFANRRLQEATGLSGDVLTRMSILDLTHPDDRQAVAQRYQKTLNGEFTPSDWAFKGIVKDGKTAWGIMRHAPVTWQGKPAVMTIIQDITQQKLAEEALHEQEQRFRAIAENSSDIIVMVDRDGTLVYESPATQHVLGFTAAERVGASAFDLVHPDDVPVIAAAFKELLRKPQAPAQRAEIRLRHKDGSWRDIEITGSGIARGSTVDGIVANLRDITERKQAEEALRESEEKFKALVENAAAVVFSLDTRGNISYISPAVETLLGVPASDLIGKSCLQYVVPDDLPGLLSSMESTVAGRFEPHEFQVTDKNGSVRHILTSSRPLTRNKELIGLIGVMVDVSEKRAAEQALSASAVKYRNLFEHTLVGMEVVDTETMRVTLANSSVARMFGFKSAADMVGTRPLDYVLPEDVEWVAGEIARLMADPDWNKVATLRSRTKDGRVIWVTGMATPFEHEGKPSMLLSLIDVTATIEARDKLRESEEKYRLLIEKTNDVIWTVDIGLRPTYVSPSIERVLGFTPEERLKQPMEAQMTPASFARMQELLQEEMTRQRPGAQEAERTITIETEYHHKNGSTLWMENLVSAIRDKDGHIVALHGVSRDMTKRRHAEEALRASEINYRNLFEHTLIGLEVVDAETMKVVLANRSVASMFGFNSPVDMVGTEPLDYVLPEDLDWVVTELSKAAADPSMHEVATMRARTQDGRVVWIAGMAAYFEYVCRPSILLSLVDMTAAKEAELRVAESEEKNRLLVDNAAEGIIVIQDGILKFANPKCTELSGYTREELLSRSFLDVVHPDDRQTMAENYVKRISGQDAANNYRFRIVDRTGRTKWLQINTVQFSWEGKPAVLSMLTDVTARKEAEEALRASEEKYRALYEDNPSMYFTVDPAGTVLSVNQFGCEQLGYAAEELLNQSVLKVFHEEDKAAAARSVARCVEHPGEVFHWELRKVRKSGSVMWVKETARAARGSDGRTVVFIVCEDVSARKQAEEALRASEEKYRGIFDESVAAIFIFDAEKHFIGTNQAGVDLLGYSREELLRMSIPDVDADPVVVLPAHQELLTGGRLTNYEHRLRRKDGTVITVLNNSRPLTDSRGRVIGMQSTLFDITERNRAQQALEDSEQRFRALIEGARDAIAVIDVNGKVTYSSPAAERMENSAGENPLTLSLSDRVHPDDAGKVSDIFESLIHSTEGTVVDLELRYRRDDDSWGVIEARATNRFHDPKIAGIVVNYRDITERRQAEEALRESDSRYRLLAENVSDVIWSANLRSGRRFFSPSVTRLLGYTLEEAQYTKVKDVISPTSYPKATIAFSKLSAGEGSELDGRASSTQLEIELIRKDGSFVWVDISITLLRDADGRPAEIFGVMRDITQRKKAEEALRTSEEYFRALIENAWDAIVIVDANGKMLYESPSSARIMGYEPEEIVGRNLDEFVRPQDIAAIADAFKRFRTEPGSILTVDAGFRHKDGHYIECEGTLQNLIHDPKVNGIIANYRDMTDRRRAEQAVRTSEERFRNLVEATSDWVWEVDPNGIYTYVSPKIHDVMGYEVGEIIGRSIFDIMPSKESTRFSKVFKSYAARREPFAFVENARLHKDGRVIIMETSGVPFFGDDGALLGYRGIGRDITTRKKVEKELENSLKKLEKTMEATIQTISYTMETRDPYTTGHQKRVTQLACAIAKEMGLAAWQIDGIRVAGLLHDIGKIAVPTEILSKPGKLSDIEFSMIKSHPKVGFDILKNVEFDWPIARIVVQHHERLDGSGYPYGIPAKDILLEAKILAVADVVEAMSSHRPYRPALGIDRALAEVTRGERTLYDPDVVRACSTVIKQRGFQFEG